MAEETHRRAGEGSGVNMTAEKITTIEEQRKRHDDLVAKITNTVSQSVLTEVEKHLIETHLADILLADIELEASVKELKTAALKCHETFELKGMEEGLKQDCKKCTLFSICENEPVLVRLLDRLLGVEQPFEEKAGEKGGDGA
jgi:hypothetical protein